MDAGTENRSGCAATLPSPTALLLPALLLRRRKQWYVCSGAAWSAWTAEAVALGAAAACRALLLAGALWQAGGRMRCVLCCILLKAADVVWAEIWERVDAVWQGRVEVPPCSAWGMEFLGATLLWAAHGGAATAK